MEILTYLSVTDKTGPIKSTDIGDTSNNINLKLAGSRGNSPPTTKELYNLFKCTQNIHQHEPYTGP